MLYPFVNAMFSCNVENLCYIFLHVERALVSMNFVLYFSACGTRSSIMEFCAIFLCVEQALVLWNFVLYFYVFKTLSGIV